VLHLLLKKQDHFDKDNKEHLQLLDPFVSLLVDGLQSKHLRVTSLSLHCFSALLSFPALPALKEHTGAVVGQLLVLLNQYAGTGSALALKGENFELVHTVSVEMDSNVGPLSLRFRSWLT
jgi:U3 small nucleolar RNA-associated protein 20